MLKPEIYDEQNVSFTEDRTIPRRMTGTNRIACSMAQMYTSVAETDTGKCSREEHLRPCLLVCFICRDPREELYGLSECPKREDV